MHEVKSAPYTTNVVTEVLNRADYLVGTSEAGARLGVAFDVVPDVHVADALFRRHLEEQEGDPAKALNHYLYEGRVDAEFVRDVVGEVQGAAIYDGRLASPMTILDFASGYGHVARHLKNVVPNGKVVAIDTQETAMYFNTAHLGVQAAVADADPARLSPFFHFDVVLVLSFLSRRPRARVVPWLDALAGFLKPGGIMIVTAQGETARRARLAHLVPDAEGYAAESRPGSDEVDAVTLSRFLFRCIERVPGIDLVLFRAAATRRLDDLYVLRKAV